MYKDIDGYTFIEESNDFIGLKSCTPIKYFCKRCGNLYKIVSNFRPHKIDQYSKMLCKECMRKNTSFELYGSETYNNRLKAKRTIDETYDEDRYKEIILKSIKTHAKNVGVEYDPDIHTSMFKFEDVQNTSKEHLMERYGVDNIMKCDIGKNNFVKSMNDTYGVDYPCQYEPFLKKSETTKMERYGDPHFNNHLKSVETNLHTYGYETPFHSKEIQENITSNFIKEYGVKRPIQIPIFREKIMNTIKETYGSDFYLGSDEFKKLKAEHPEWYGEFYFSTEEFKKLYLTHPEWRMNNSSEYYYIYDSFFIRFDSSWELYFFLYCVDMGISIVRCPIVLTYEYEGKTKQYTPDFLINGNKLVEVKGPQFYKDGDPTKEMIFPYNKKKVGDEWVPLTPEEKTYMNGLYEAKHRCGLANGVEFITEKDMVSIFKYIDDKYGKNFVNSLRVDKSMKYKNFIYSKLYYMSMLECSQNSWNPFNTDFSKEYCDYVDVGKTPFD